jgi:hypothetical protein
VIFVNTVLSTHIQYSAILAPAATHGFIRPGTSFPSQHTVLITTSKSKLTSLFKSTPRLPQALGKVSPTFSLYFNLQTSRHVNWWIYGNIIKGFNFCPWVV